MADRPTHEQLHLDIERSVGPENMLESRIVGHVPSDSLPWLADGDPKQVSISEVVFPEGSIYVASAIPNRLKKYTEEVRAKDPSSNEQTDYSRLDEFMMKAARLEASGGSGQSDRIHIVRGRSEAFSNFTIKSYGESPRPNTRRMYFVHTNLGRFGDAMELAPGVKPLDRDKSLLVRLGYADKQNQLKVLKYLTGKSRKDLRAGNAGSI